VGSKSLPLSGARLIAATVKSGMTNSVTVNDLDLNLKRMAPPLKRMPLTLALPRCRKWQQEDNSKFEMLL